MNCVQKSFYDISISAPNYNYFKVFESLGDFFRQKLNSILNVYTPSLPTGKDFRIHMSKSKKIPHLRQG